MQFRRKILLEQLFRYKNENPCESLIVDRFVSLLSATEGCFYRNCFPGHITGSAWLVNASRTHVLLTHHRKLNMWLQLGGHADGNENPMDVALREAYEESGLSEIVPFQQDVFDVDIHEIPAHRGEPTHEHFDIRFALICSESDTYVVSDESHDLAWVEISKINDYTQEPSMLRMAEKWMRNLD